MKILSLPSYFYPFANSTSISGIFCMNQAILLNKNGFKVDILANIELSWKKEKLKPFFYPKRMFLSRENGINVYRNLFWRLPLLHELNMRRWVKQTVKLFDEYLEQNGMPDIIHAHSSMWAGYAAYLIKQKFQVPYILTEHNGLFGSKFQYTDEALKDWYTPFLVKIFNNADYIIPVSDQLVGKISTYALANKKIEVISNVYDQIFKYRERKPISDKFIFFTANSYQFVKGYDILLPAFDMLCDKVRNVELRIAGSWFEQLSFQKIRNQCKHKDKIHILNKLSKNQVNEELLNANAFVLASRVEAQPVSVLEAIATGLPVVCTNVVPENIITENEGYRVETENVDQLSNAMFKMLKNVEKFDGRSIASHAIKVAGEDNFVSKISKVYLEVLGRTANEINNV